MLLRCLRHRGDGSKVWVEQALVIPVANHKGYSSRTISGIGDREQTNVTTSERSKCEDKFENKLLGIEKIIDLSLK